MKGGAWQQPPILLKVVSVQIINGLSPDSHLFTLAYSYSLKLHLFLTVLPMIFWNISAISLITSLCVVCESIQQEKSKSIQHIEHSLGSGSTILIEMLETDMKLSILGLFEVNTGMLETVNYVTRIFDQQNYLFV